MVGERHGLQKRGFPGLGMAASSEEDVSEAGGGGGGRIMCETRRMALSGKKGVAVLRYQL